MRTARSIISRLQIASRTGASRSGGAQGMLLGMWISLAGGFLPHATSRGGEPHA